MHYRHRRRSLYDTHRPAPRRLHWIVAIFFLALSLLLRSRLQLPVIYLPR
jgi:hypothetical protein